MEIDDNLDSLLSERRESLHAIKNSLSSNTLQNIFEEQVKETKAKSGDYIGEMVASMLTSGIKNELLGSQIKKAMNMQRERILRKNFFNLSLKIISDALLIVEDKRKFNNFKLEDILIAGKITDAIKTENTEAVINVLNELYQDEHIIVLNESKQKDVLQELFDDNDESNYGGLVLMEMFYDLFYSQKKLQKPAVHSPIFESIIAYT